MNQELNNLDNTSIKDQIRPYLRVWPWIILSALIGIGIAAVYLRYSTSVYSASATILIKDTQSGGGLSEMGALGDISLLGNNYNSLENEIAILKSKQLMKKVVDELDLNVFYKSEGRFKTTNIYKNTSITVALVDDTSNALESSLQFYVRKDNDSLFQFKKSIEDPWNEVAYGKAFNINGHDLIGFPNFKKNKDSDLGSLNQNSEKANQNHIKVSLLPKEQLAISLSNQLQVATTGRSGSVVNLSIANVVGEKAEDILDQLIKEYNKDAIEDKNLVAQKTLTFIEERLVYYEDELSKAEQGIQGYKDRVRITNLETEIAIDLERYEALNEKIITVETQLRLATDTRSYLESSLAQGSIISMAGLTEVDLDNSISTYNQLLTKYKRLQENATDSSPVLATLAIEIEGLKSIITSSLDGYIQSLQFQKNQLQGQIKSTGYDISKVPERERQTRDINRNQQVIEAIYLILREKQETTAISLAVASPKAKVIDAAYASPVPVSPQPKIILLGAFLAGIILPIAIVYLRTLFYNKIESRKDLEKALPQLAILGEIPRLDRGDSEFIEKNDRSVLAESFRILRTNLYYKLNALQIKDRNCKVVIVTSTIQGEGKTLVAYNLALTLASPKTKVLLLGADIRNPQLHRYLNRDARRAKGLTEFLVDESINSVNLTYASDVNPDLDILLSGQIPPNPAELLMQDRMGDVFTELYDNYDIIVVDTAPTLLVTDTFLINKYADMTVFVSRAGHTERSLLDFIGDNDKGEKLNNIALVLNSVKLTNFGYGNKYGYSYGKKRDSFFKKLYKKITGKM